MTSAAGLAVVLSCVAPAVGWTQAAGHHYLKLGGRAIIGSGGYLADGSFAPAGATFVDARAEIYAELGVLDWLTVVARGVPLGWATFADAATAYLGPLVAGARVGSARGPFPHTVFALEARYGYTPPLGEIALGRGRAHGLVWSFTPVVETHRIEIEAQLGISLPWGMWVTATAGMDHATRKNMGSAFFGMTQLGAQPTAMFAGEAHFSWHQPTHDFADSNITGAGSTRYLGAGVSLTLRLTPVWGVYAGVDGGFAVSANAAAPALTVGIEHRGAH